MSGIRAEHARKLHISEPLSKSETEALTGVEDAVAYEIPYHDIHGRRLAFSRWKLLYLGDQGKMRYYQEQKTIPRIYIPPLLDWVKIARDPSQRIVITEGEKKAACACIHKIPCIALGGVWSHKSSKFGLEMLSDFDQFEWQDRVVEICYDSDLAENYDVERARGSLSASLRQRGARVFTRRLPATNGKTGLDDFLVAYGPREYEKLECAEDGGSRELHELNSRLVYVASGKFYYDHVDQVPYKSQEELAKKFGWMKIADERGKPRRAVDIWAEWEARREVHALTFEPGKPEILGRSLNTWRAHDIRPTRGDCSHVLEIINSLELPEWVLQWLAYPLQHPGTKLYTSILIWSRAHGTGKSFLGRIMREIYGPTNSSKITSAQLHSSFNGWLANKQFIVGEEVSDYAGKADYNMLKDMVTAEQIVVNQKFAPEYELPNYANFMFTSNDPAAIKIDGPDRRFYVSSLETERSQKFWREMDRWFSAGGSAHFYWHLLNRVDTSSFDPKARAPDTDEKKIVSYVGMSELDQWCHDLLRDPDSVISSGPGKLRAKQDVFPISMIAGWRGDIDHGINNSALGRALRRAGAISPASPVLCQDGKLRRMVAIRNLSYWKVRARDYKEWAHNFALGSVSAESPEGVPEDTAKSLRAKKSGKSSRKSNVTKIEDARKRRRGR